MSFSEKIWVAWRHNSDLEISYFETLKYIQIM